VNREADRRNVVRPDDLRHDDAADVERGHDLEVGRVADVDADVDRLLVCAA
jgi:hypothetical protein